MTPACNCPIDHRDPERKPWHLFGCPLSHAEQQALDDSDTAAMVLHVAIPAAEARARESWPLATPAESLAVHRKRWEGRIASHRAYWTRGGKRVEVDRECGMMCCSEAREVLAILDIADALAGAMEKALDHYDGCREAELRAVVAELVAAAEEADDVLEILGYSLHENDVQGGFARTQLNAALAHAREVQS